MTDNKPAEAQLREVLARRLSDRPEHHIDLIVSDIAAANLLVAPPTGDEREALIDILVDCFYEPRTMSAGDWAKNVAGRLVAARLVNADEKPTGDEREAEALAWQSYRNDVGPNRKTLGRESVAFKAGWDAARLVNADTEGDPAPEGQVIIPIARIRELRAAKDTAEAERDAATAALERIRVAVSGHPECDRYEEDDVISCGWKCAYASVLAALDGAPEPAPIEGQKSRELDHNAEQRSTTDPSDEQVEAAGQVLFEHWDDWADDPDDIQGQGNVELVRAALKAAAVTPEPEWEPRYRARAKSGPVVGDERIHKEGAIDAYWHANSEYPFEMDDETPIIEMRYVTEWIEVQGEQ